MMPVFLVTDVLLWVVLLGVAVYGRAVWQNPLLRSTWGKVFQSRSAMVAIVLLLVAIVLTMLDSMHFRRLESVAEGKPQYSNQVLSVLDVCLTHLRERTEKTYSAPFALHSFNKETIDMHGRAWRDYPRLTFGGAHLNTEQERGYDLLRRAFKGLVIALLISLPIIFMWRRWIARDNKDQATGNLLRGAWLRGQSAAQSTFLSVVIVGAVLWQWSLGFHVLGTDKVGADILYSVLKSIRTAMVLGLLTTLITLPIALFAGLAAGYFRGWVDDVIQYIYTTLNSIPSVLLIAATILMSQVWLEANPQWFTTSVERGDVRLFFLCVILGMTSWTGLARLLRGEVLKLREMEYIQAAKVFGISNRRILFTHLLPNVMHLVIIALVMDFSGLVLAEAVLSYVGVGVDPGTTSFGTMINAARLELSREPMVWWTLAAAFMVMLMLVLAANLFADVVRDAFDPRLQQGRA